VVTIVPGGTLILATGTGSSVAKIAGTGKITAGFTTISGAWDAVGGNVGTVTFLSAATGATITADGTGATGLKAGAGAIITQNAGEATNNLIIGAATDIDLGGTDAEVGVILLKNDTSEGKSDATKNAKLTLSVAATSTIKTGNAIGAKGAAMPLATAGVSVVSGSAFEKFGITNLAGDGTKAKVTSTVATTEASAGPAGKLAGLLSGDADGTVTGGGALTTSPDGRISALTVTEADTTP
jgi:hypothetical protein